jgi:hypothetical protein
MMHQNTEKLLFNVGVIVFWSRPLLAGYGLESWSNPIAKFRNPETNMILGKAEIPRRKKRKYPE